MHHADKRKVLLHPGEFLFGERGTHIHTILGSCIAITLWHPMLQIGGMCHFVTPGRPITETNELELPEGKYGDEAMQLFKLAATLHGTELSDYVAKIFGGADVHDAKHGNGIGEKNTEKAMRLLVLNDIELSVAHVGESGSRRIVFDVESGHVWVKHTSSDGHRLGSQSGRT